MEIEVEDVVALRFADGSPVRAASAVVRFGDGWLVAQDDATHAAWLRDAGAERVRALPPVAGLDTFEDAAGTKHLKPDLEAAFAVSPAPVDDRVLSRHPAEGPTAGDDVVLLLGSGSSPARMRGCLVALAEGGPHATVADLAPLYASVARSLGVAPDLLNLEGACALGDVARWFHRGLPAADVPTGSVDVELAALVAAVLGTAPPADVVVRGARHYDLGVVRGVGLAVTDVVALRDGRLLVSAAAEDAPDPRADGPVVASALAVLDGERVVASAPLPHVEGGVPKVEGLALVGEDDGGARLLATIDSDDATAASLAVRLRVRW